MAAFRAAVVLALCLAAGVAHAQPSRLSKAGPAMAAAIKALEKAQADGTLSLAANNNSNYITISESTTAGRYIAPSCVALFQLSAHINSLQGDGARFRTITIDLPCTAGSVRVRGQDMAWDTPVYDCYDRNNTFPSVLGNIGLYYNPGANVGGSLTVRAYTTGRNCDLRANKRPTLFNGNPVRDASEIPLIILGEDGNGTTNADAAGQATVTLQDLVIQGSLQSDFNPGFSAQLRPGISAGSLRRLTVRNVDITGTYGTYMGAAIELIDTPTTMSCAQSKPCNLQYSYTAIAEPNFIFGAGGALAVRAEAIGGSIFSSTWINFIENEHEQAAGAWYVHKLFNGAVRVSIQNAQVKNNMAFLCAGALTVRADGYYQEGDNKAIPGIALTINMPTPGTPASNTYRWTGNQNGDGEGQVMCGVLLKDVNPFNNVPEPMPYDVKQKTKISTKVLTGAPWTLVGPLANFYVAEYAYTQ